MDLLELEVAPFSEKTGPDRVAQGAGSLWCGFDPWWRFHKGFGGQKHGSLVQLWGSYEELGFQWY